jgi:5-methylcytosine-specific restriction protein B
MEKTTLHTICSNIEVWHDWRNDYNKNVPLFIAAASRGTDWRDWSQEVFHEYFMKSSGQCVSSLRQGYFSNNEKEQLKLHWREIAPLLQQIALNQDEPLYDIYAALKATIRKYTVNDKRAATNRLIAALQPQLLCTIVNEQRLWELVALLKTHVTDFSFDWKHTWFENSYETLQLFKKALSNTDAYQIMTYPWQVYEEYDFTDNEKNNDMSEYENEAIISLLKYKKQIILQGPPGTGKTRLAKELARQLVGAAPKSGASEISDAEIALLMQEGISFPSVVGEADYTISLVNRQEQYIVLRRASGTEGKTTFSVIKDYYRRQLWEDRVVSGNDDRRANAIAKYLFDKRDEQHEVQAKNEEQLKIIQFHPSYSYEDFVRGITAKPNEDGEGILYKAENKILGAFADLALNNYWTSKGAHQLHSVFQQKLNILLEHVRATIEEGSGYIFGDKSTARIIAIKEDGLLYSFPSREDIKYKVLFSDLEKVFSARDKVEKPTDLRDMEQTIGLVMKGKYPYYYMLLKQLESFEGNEEQVKKQDLKKYVLIIDEINRANLSAVLGELIYALEYRGEAVESIYDVDGNTLIIPPNLYIIGTMNTADRSVGHIDYAIRRRFAFVEVAPQALQDNEEIYFNTEAYTKVAALFNPTNVSSEFEPKDVQIGHSYFIAKKKEATDDTKKRDSFRLKMDYEIIPILNEYVKDGVLVGDINGKSIKQYIEELKSAGL